MIGIRPDNSGPNRVDDDHESLPCSGKYHNKRPEMNRSIMAWLANQIHEVKSAKASLLARKTINMSGDTLLAIKLEGAALDTTWKITIQQHLIYLFDAFFPSFFPLISQGMSHPAKHAGIKLHNCGLN